jgi:NDP-sugar pyrophosphorylase family protein/aminoglycoside/choline kinase family phosphotransferase
MRAKRPNRAVVLAAGLGTRMDPLSRDLPKPLMPLWGRPLVRIGLETLASWGVRRALVNLHHGADEILRELARNPVPGLALDFSFEPEILGTGGALRRASWFLGDAPFWILNADVAAAVRPGPLLRRFRRDTLAALWMEPARGPRTVRLRRGRVVSFRDAAPAAAGRCTLAGLHLVSPDVLDYLPDAGFATIVEAYERALLAGRRIEGVVVPGSWWADLGTPEQYVAAHRETLAERRRGAPAGRLVDAACLRRAAALRRSGARIRGFVAAGADVRVERGARIEDSVVWSGARLARDADLRGAIAGRGVEARGAVPHVAVRAGLALDAAERAVAARLGLDAASAAAIRLAPRGSARTFTRLVDGDRRILLIRYRLERPENARYAGHARFLAAAGVRVPAIRFDDPERRILAVEDLGDRSLGDAVRERGPRGALDDYRAVIEQVRRLHGEGARRARRLRLALEPPFDADLFARERALFFDHFAVGPRAPAPAARRAIARELARVARALEREPRVLLHRDLQSSNILLTPRGPAFIDFQGLRFGPAVYDLASLLCDPYVELPAAIQAELLRPCAEDWPGGPIAEERFRLGAVQRLIQALGAYGRLGAIRGAERFLAHVPAALRMLARALGRVDPPLPALRAQVEDWRGRAGGAARREARP